MAKIYYIVLRSKLRRVYIVTIYHNPICNILRGVCVTIWTGRKLLIIVPLGSGNKDVKSFFFILASFCAVELFKHLLSVQFSCCHVRAFVNPWTAHTRLPCPSQTPRACSNSCPSSQRCHPTISSSVVPFSSCLQSSPA